MESKEREFRRGIIITLILVAVLSAALVAVNVIRLINANVTADAVLNSVGVPVVETAAEKPAVPEKTEAPKASDENAKTVEDTEGNSAETEPGNVTETEDFDTEEENEAPVCSISIVCDSVLDYKGKFDVQLLSAVPPNGIILASSDVELSGGESVYDVLCAVCEYTGIPLNVRESGFGAYVSGINGLNEKDFGASSGWTYYVNGAFANTSCDKYKVEDGDGIVWAYVCG